MKFTQFPRYGSIRCSALALVVVPLVATLSACDRKPEGQVVAVVDGREITIEELNGELPQTVGREDADSSARNAALQQVVDRVLLAEAAREMNVDTSPEFILREKKLRETLLVQMLNEKLAREVKDPSSQDIDKMIADNPQAFAGRTVFALDQLVFAAPKRTGIIEALGPTKTMDDVVAVLNRSGIKFNRGSATVDSASLTPAMFAEFKRVGSSEPMVIPAGSTITVAKIMAARPVPISGDPARPVAGTGYKREKTQERLREVLKSARKGADITYQTGYGAPQGPAGPSANGTPSGPPPSETAMAPADAAVVPTADR